MTNAAVHAPHRAPIAQAALALGAFATGTTEFATMSILPPFSRDLHVSIPTGAHAISAYAIGVVLGAPLFAVLSRFYQTCLHSELSSSIDFALKKAKSIVA